MVQIVDGTMQHRKVGVNPEIIFGRQGNRALVCPFF